MSDTIINIKRAAQEAKPFVDPICAKCKGQMFDSAHPERTAAAVHARYGSIPNDCTTSTLGGHSRRHNCPFLHR